MTLGMASRRVKMVIQYGWVESTCSTFIRGRRAEVGPPPYQQSQICSPSLFHKLREAATVATFFSVPVSGNTGAVMSAYKPKPKEPHPEGKRPIVQIENVHKTYLLGIEGVPALRYRVMQMELKMKQRCDG